MNSALRRSLPAPTSSPGPRTIRKSAATARHALRVACVALGLVLASSAWAEGPERRSSCREDGKALSAVRQELSILQARSDQIDAVFQSGAPASLEAGQLEQLLAGDDGEDSPTDWPESVACSRIQQEYSDARDDLVRSKAQLSALRHDYWDALPPKLREALLAVWDSRTRLAQSAQALEGLLPQAMVDRETLLRQRRHEFSQMLPELAQPAAPGDIGLWLEHWHAALELASDPLSPPQGMVDALSPDTGRALSRHYYLAQLDALELAEAYNRVRTWLWQNHRHAFRRSVDAAFGSLHLLLDEARAARNVVRWLYVDAAAGAGRGGGSTHALFWRFFQGFEYLFGVLGLVALGAVARRVKRPAHHLQGAFARSYRGSRARAQVVRFTSGIPALLPWILGWLGLLVLEAAYRNNHLTLLLPVLPFARLYVVYGFVCIAGEWFLHRIAELAGCYLNPDQQAGIATRARRFARILILPWLAKDLVALTVGPSLTLQLLDWLTVVAALVALGLLLKPWQREFVQALQAFLPESLDRWCETLFSGARFVFFAPLAAPLVLVAMMLFFLHKGLVDFDWYRKLMARSFKLRSAAIEEPASAVASDAEALGDYRRWFGASCDSQRLPFINIATAQKIQESLGAWLAEKTDENSLLLSGERGSGKTTLLQNATDWLATQPEPPRVLRIEVPAKTSTREAVAALLEQHLGVPLADGPATLVKSDAARTPTVLVLDNAQNFFLREVGGLGGWEYFLDLTRARVLNLYWIVIMNNQSWAYLGNVFGREYQFNRQLQTRPWSQNEIRSLVLSRNQLSGYRIQYDSILLSTRGPEAGNIRNAEQLYFSLLWDACGGNPGLALRMWLTSVTVQRGEVTVGLPAEVSGAALEKLREELHFVYAALVLHENMTSEELVATTAIPESLVRAALKIGFDQGFIERSANRRYRVVPLWYPSLTRLLARKNLLHE